MKSPLARLMKRKTADPEDIEEEIRSELYDDSDPEANDAFIRCENLFKIYKVADLEVVALQGLDLNVQKGELMAIIGASGSGKSTLLNMLGGLDVPSAGVLRVDGKDLLKMSDRDRVAYKRDTVGFVWQNNARNLIPYLTAFENVQVPMILSGRNSPEWAEELLEAVGLEHRMNHKLSEMSGGEQQRVAIAISLANRPPLLLADEPTGSVDTETAGRILSIFRRVNEQYGTTIIIVTHDQHMSKQVNRVVAIRDGKTSTEMVRRFSSGPVADWSERSTTISETHDEFVVLDRAGRLQVPKEFLEQLNIKKKARLVMDGDAIRILPEDDVNQA